MVTYKKLSKYLVFTIYLLLSTSACSSETIKDNSVKVGADVLLNDEFKLIENKNIGIITNHTGVLSNGTHLVDTLFSRKDVNVISLFGPEHGIRGDAPDGSKIEHGIDKKTGLPVYSLYGKIRKPTPEMLKNIDLLLFDIQDIGARFYTFISTMYYAIEAAAENRIPIIILDRPNPINGETVEGAILDSNFISFVGIEEIPIRHGMTVGELAKLMNQKRFLAKQKTADLKVVKIKNWHRNFYYDDCNINWIKPSPNMPNLETAIVYPGLCLLEGTNISEGRGTFSPFLQIGSPYANSEEILKEINNLDLQGIKVESVKYTPVAIENMSTYPKYKNEECNGIKLTITNRNLFEPVKFGINLIYVFHKLYPENFSFRENWIDKLWGSSFLRESILDNKTPDIIFKAYQKELQNFKEYRKHFLLYK